MKIADLIDKNIVVNCKTEEEAKEFIELSLKNKLATNGWDNGNTNFCDYLSETCYRCAVSPHTGLNITVYESVRFYIEKGYKIISVNDIDEICSDEIYASSSSVSVLF